MATFLVIYTQHPYYKGGQFTPWRSYYPVAFVIWLAVGLFYVKATPEKFKGMRYTMRDGGLHLLLLGQSLLKPRGTPKESEELAQQARRAIRGGVAAALAFTMFALALRLAGVPFRPELYLGTSLGVKWEIPAFGVGLAAQV